jgi:hypothetical protein
MCFYLQENGMFIKESTQENVFLDEKTPSSRLYESLFGDIWCICGKKNIFRSEIPNEIQII